MTSGSSLVNVLQTVILMWDIQACAWTFWSRNSLPSWCKDAAIREVSLSEHCQNYSHEECLSDTTPKSMVLNVIFIRFKVSINSAAAVPRLSLLAVFQWPRLYHYLKRFKVTAFKQSFFSTSLIFQNINHCVAHQKELISFSSYSPNDWFD